MYSTKGRSQEICLQGEGGWGEINIFSFQEGAAPVGDWNPMKNTLILLAQGWAKPP